MLCCFIFVSSPRFIWWANWSCSSAHPTADPSSNASSSTASVFPVVFVCHPANWHTSSCATRLNSIWAPSNRLCALQGSSPRRFTHWIALTFLAWSWTGKRCFLSFIGRSHGRNCRYPKVVSVAHELSLGKFWCWFEWCPVKARFVIHLSLVAPLYSIFELEY